MVCRRGTEFHLHPEISRIKGTCHLHDNPPPEDVVATLKNLENIYFQDLPRTILSAWVAVGPPVLHPFKSNVFATRPRASFEPLGELGQLLLHGHGAARGLRSLPGLLQALLVVVRVQEAKHGILEGRVNHPVAVLAHTFTWV